MVQSREQGGVYAAAPDGSVAIMRTRGRRITSQRALIWQALLERAGLHQSASQLADAVPTLHRSTVYRTLEMLVEDGLVLCTDLGGDRSYYELAADHPHHHVVCTGCGRIAHIHDEEVVALVAGVEDASGFKLARRELTFAGLCPDCADQRAAAS